MQELSSLTSESNSCPPCLGSVESKPLDCQESPQEFMCFNKLHR